MTKTIRVLMVDDEEQFRETTRKILNRRGFDTLLAASGEQALEKLGQQPDVVVLDIKMPGMDGHAVLKEILKRSPDMPVIMLTGHGALPSAREAHREGAFDYLSKPCDMDLLAAKINEAHRHRGKGAPAEESSLTEVMIPIGEYTTVEAGQTVREAIARLKESFRSSFSTSRIMETGHRSILVLGNQGKILGILTIRNLMEAVMPAYLSAPKPSTADAIQYSPLFWSGMLASEIGRVARKKVEEIMSPSPLTIDHQASCLEAAYLMVSHNRRRLAVAREGKVIGIVREQDLFFEMERILSRLEG